MDALVKAIKSENLNEVRRLVQEKAPIDELNSREQTVLMDAAREWHTIVTQFLLSSQTNQNLQTSDGLTTLRYVTIKVIIR